jgi:hypothetical protein
MSEGYQPEIDNTPMFTEQDSANHRSIIGYNIWKIVVGMFDLSFSTSTMSRFNMRQREGYLKAAKENQVFLKKIYKGEDCFIQQIKTILLTPLKFIPTGMTSTLMVKKKYSIIFLTQCD